MRCKVLDNQERRNLILKILNESSESVKGSALGKKFNVSRQVIVQDISLLRATGEDITATPNGYIKIKREVVLNTIVCRHSGKYELEDELEIIVSHGGKILDVFVEHGVYGEVKGNLNIRTKDDIEKFMEKLEASRVEPLCSLTDGLHMHTIETTNKESFEKIKNELLKKGYLII